MKWKPGEAVSAADLKTFPTKGWGLSGTLMQCQPDYYMGAMGQLGEAEATRLRDTLAERVADGSLRVTFIEVWDGYYAFNVHHISGPTMKGTFEIGGNV